MKFIQKIVTPLLTALLFLSLQVNAALITEEFDVEVVSGPGTGTFGTILVEYEETLITGVGSEFLSDPDFAVVLDLFGQIFTNSDDIDYPGLPGLEFEDGDIVIIDYIISEFGFFNPVPIDDPAIGEIFGGDVFGGTWFVSTEGATAIPEPSLTFFLMSLMLISLLRSKQPSRLPH